jgi:hypothetical protein
LQDDVDISINTADDIHTTSKKNGGSNGVVLKDKWKFVRNVMDNMERQKKMPLKDSTINHINKGGPTSGGGSATNF